MELTIENLKAEVMRLSAADRSRLLDALLDSIDQDDAIEREWEQLADRRDAELDSGMVEAIDGAAVLRACSAAVELSRMTFSLHPEVERDLDEAAAHLLQHGSAQVGARFLAEFGRVVGLLVEDPCLASGFAARHPWH